MRGVNSARRLLRLLRDGSILGMLIVQPASIHAALATGLGWPFIVRFVLEGMKTIGKPPESGGRAVRR